MQTDDEIIVDEIARGEAEVEHASNAAVDPDEFYRNNAFRVVYQTNNFLLPQIADLIKLRKVINIRPEYQRRLRWSNKQKSRLIESLLLNVPIPPVFFYESSPAEYEVMDGQQRLNAIKEFLNNEFKLTGLTVLWPLNGLNYVSLPPRVSRALRRPAVSAITLLLENDDEVVGRGISYSDIRRFIFDRLNTGGKPLNAQELRNAIFPGRFNELLIELARDNLFTSVWGMPPYTEADPNDYYENPRRQRNRLYSTMGDCEIVLRFFALRDEAYIKGPMRNILDDCMKRNQGISADDAKTLKNAYLERLALAVEMFEGGPFEIPNEEGKYRRSVALQDAILVSCDRLWKDRKKLPALGPKIQDGLDILAQDEDAGPILTGQGNTATTIKARLNLVRRVFREAIREA